MLHCNQVKQQGRPEVGGDRTGPHVGPDLWEC
jgi:hypothetical protein